MKNGRGLDGTIRRTAMVRWVTVVACAIFCAACGALPGANAVAGGTSGSPLSSGSGSFDPCNVPASALADFGGTFGSPEVVGKPPPPPGPATCQYVNPPGAERTLGRDDVTTLMIGRVSRSTGVAADPFLNATPPLGEILDLPRSGLKVQISRSSALPGITMTSFCEDNQYTWIAIVNCSDEAGRTAAMDTLMSSIGCRKIGS